MIGAMRHLLAVPLLLAALAPAASAQTVTMQPSQLHIGQTDRVTFRMSLPAGRWVVTMEVPAFVRGHNAFGSEDPLDPYGTPFTPAGPPAVGAGATVTGGDPGTAGLGNVCRRGYDAPANPFATVTMPEGGGSLAWGFWLSKAPRWSVTDYRVAFRIRGEDGRSVRVVPAAPVVSGRYGTRFRLAVRRLPRGEFRVQGTTQPVLRRARVSIMTARAVDDPGLLVPNFPEDFTAPRATATIRTDSRGRFEYRWRPKRDRFYALWAASFTANGRLGDSGCPLRIDTGS
jgi:hypothetical protein